MLILLMNLETFASMIIITSGSEADMAFSHLANRLAPRFKRDPKSQMSMAENIMLFIDRKISCS